MENLQILHLENTERDVSVLQAYFSRAGFAVNSIQVDSRESAQLALTARPWDVVLCDFTMPDYLALEALILTKELDLDVPFIFMSWSNNHTSSLNGARVAERENLAQLAAAIERELEAADLRRANRDAERKLHHSEERYRRLIDTAYEGICTLNARMRLTYVNQRLADMLGYAVDEIIGKTPWELMEESYRAEQKWILRTKGPREQFDICLRHKDGSEVWSIVCSTPIYSEIGKFAGGLMMLTDITERRRAETQFRQAQKMEAIGLLAGGIAHDFNNILTAINGYSELALRKMGETDNLRGYVQEIKKAGDRAASLTAQLLAFSRKQVLQPKVVGLNSLITDLKRMLDRLIGENITLDVVLDHNLGNIKADPGQIEQVIMNLAVNARDAMPDGGTLNIETINVEVDEEYARRHVAITPGPYVMLMISDTGQGMDSATQARIFDPFFTTKEMGKGTGLGLSTVYGIVKQSGGNIWVYSEVGRGTSFKIYLPRIVEPNESVKDLQANADGMLGSETLLLVEDDDTLRNLTAEVLREFGYHVLVASSGKVALSVCESYDGPIHLLLTDVIMPVMSGPETSAAALRARPSLRVLYMSGYTDGTIVHHGVLNEDTNFIQKPFSPDALAQRVREVLDRA